MKLALMALAIELCLARLFTGSWGWAAVIVVIYCVFVYIRTTMSVKKRNKNKKEAEVENFIIQNSINDNIKSRNQLHHIYPTIDTSQEN